MGMKKIFLCLLYLTSFLTCSTKACDTDACQIGTSIAIGTGCAVTGAAVSVGFCAVTFGIGCAVGVASTAGICGALTKGAEYGCDTCSDDLTFGDLVSELDKNKEEILTELNGLESNQELMLTKIDDIAAEMSEKFAISHANDKKIIQNQIKLILLNDKSLKKLDNLSNSLSHLKEEVILGQYIAQYSDATSNAENVFNKFETIPRGPFGIFEQNVQMEWFRDAALHHTTGLLQSMNSLFDFLNGGGIWHGGKSVFEKLPEFGCDENVFQFFLEMQKKSMDLFQVAMTMKHQPILPIYKRRWAEKFAKTYAAKNKYCSCPNGLLLRKTGKLSKVLNFLPSNPTRTRCENLGELVELPEDVNVRKKVKNVLEVQNFDIDTQSIMHLGSYWTEDIQLLKSLHDSNNLAFKRIYDDLETCIDPNHNSNACCPRINGYGINKNWTMILQSEIVNGNCHYAWKTEKGEAGFWMCGDRWWVGKLSDKGQCKGEAHSSVASKFNNSVVDDSLQWKDVRTLHWKVATSRGRSRDANIMLKCVDQQSSH